MVAHMHNLRRAFNHRRRGFSLVDMMIAISIMTLIASVIILSFAAFRTRKNLDAAVEMVMVAFSQAHFDTISSKGDSPYGVAIQDDEVIYFKGATYPGEGAVGNIHYRLPSTIEIANITLNGGGTEIFFNRINGGTAQYGYFDVRAKSATTTSNRITISQVGIVSL